MGDAERLCLLGFDMETDVGSWTPYYEGLQRGTPRLLEALSHQDLAATFYFTAHAAGAHPEVVHLVRAAGHEIGCHGFFHETLGEELFPVPNGNPVLAEELPLRLGAATHRVREMAGVPVVSFRCPRLFGSTAVVNALEALGYETDASYPLYFFAERLVPYHPSRADWAKEGDLHLLEIPNFADLSIESGDPYGRDRDQWPRYRTEGAGALLSAVDHFAELVSERGLPCVLCFYLHPWEFLEMPQGPIHYGEGAVLPDPFLVAGCGDHALRELEVVLAGLEQRGFLFRTARDIARR